jgi:regulatory protein
LAILTEIRVPRRGSRRRTLVLDGEPWRDAPSDVVAEARLKQGSDVDPTELGRMLADIEPRCARDRAVRLLTYRERSISDLGDRLAEDGYLPETITGVIERLVSVGLVDDERFARAFARSLTQIRRLGRSRAARELAAHGIEPRLASEALDEALSVDDEMSAAVALARSLAARPGVTRDKIAGRLARRGYTPRIALEAAREAMSEAEDASAGEPWDVHDAVPAPDGLDGL